MTYDFVEYRLAFDGPLRIGADHRERAAVWPRLHSDLLYRAIASAWRELQPGDSAEMPGWPDAPAARLSSAFPWTDSHGSLAPAPADPGRLVRLLAPADGVVEHPDGRHWTVSSRARAKFNRRTARRDERFVIHEVRFTQAAGLWFGARFDSPEVRQHFEAVLRYLGDCGIAGGRSTGAGRFRVVAIRDIGDRGAPGGDGHHDRAVWCLSRYRPTESEYANGALLAEPGVPAWSGWSVPGTESDLRFLAEGSILATHSAFDPLRAGSAIAVDMPGGAASSPRPGWLFAMALPLAVAAGVSSI